MCRRTTRSRRRIKRWAKRTMPPTRARAHCGRGGARGECAHRRCASHIAPVRCASLGADVRLADQARQRGALLSCARRGDVAPYGARVCAGRLRLLQPGHLEQGEPDFVIQARKWRQRVCRDASVPPGRRAHTSRTRTVGMAPVVMTAAMPWFSTARKSAVNRDYPVSRSGEGMAVGTGSRRRCDNLHCQGAMNMHWVGEPGRCQVQGT